jgi:hypothetical protein
MSLVMTINHEYFSTKEVCYRQYLLQIAEESSSFYISQLPTVKMQEYHNNFMNSISYQAKKVYADLMRIEWTYALKTGALYTSVN